MSCNTWRSNHKVQNKFGSTSTNASSQVLTKWQLQTYIDHYEGKWVGKKRNFVNVPIYTNKSFGSVEHIMVDKPTKLSTNITAIEFTITEPPWSILYEKRCELEVYCQKHELRIPKTCSVELPRDKLANILAHLEQENNQMQR